MNNTVQEDKVNHNDFLEMVKSRRSVRAFDPNQEVNEEWIMKALEIARWAPSAANCQPWEFIIIRDPEMKERIVDIYKKQLESKQELDYLKWKKKTQTGSIGFKNAPVFILVLGDTRVVESFPARTLLEKGRDHFISSLAHANVLLHLALSSFGFATQWVSDSSSPYMSSYLKEWLNIPDHMRIYDMVPVGYSYKIPKAPARRELSEMIHKEKYDENKVRNDKELKTFLWNYTRLGLFGLHNNENKNSKG